MSTAPTKQTVESFDGCRLAAAADAPSGSEAEGSLPILFSNSLASDMSMWNGVVSGLSHRAIRYDSRGHGGSDAPGGPYTQNMLGRDALAVLDHFHIDRAIVCGLSLGGHVAAWLAAHHPDRVAGIVLANTACAFKPAEMWRDRAAQARETGMAQFVEPTLVRWFPETFRAKRPEVMARVGEMIGSIASEGYASSCEALACTDMSDDLRLAKCPALVIAGEKDPSATVAQGKEIAACHGDATLCRLDAAHLSAIEKPEEFRKALEGFAAELGT